MLDLRSMVGHHVAFPVTVQNVVHETQLVAKATQNLNQLLLVKPNNKEAHVTLAFHQPLVESADTTRGANPWRCIRLHLEGLSFVQASTLHLKVGDAAVTEWEQQHPEPAYFEFRPQLEDAREVIRYPVSIEIKVHLKEGISEILLTGLDLWENEQ